MKTLKISIIAFILAFGVQFANAQVHIGVGVGYPAPHYYPYHRVIVERPYPYGYYAPAYYHPYAYGGYYARPVYHPYYRAHVYYRRRW